MNPSKLAQRPVRFLTGQSVYLRPFSQDDVELYFPMLFDPEGRRLTGTQHSFTKEFVARYLEEKGQDRNDLLLLIARCDTDEVIGDIALQDIQRMNRSANLRVMIDSQEHQGKGYGSEAILLMLEYGFGIANLHRIELNVYSYNQRALHVYQKLGFQQEGIQREALYYNHAYHDSILMSMLEHEYRERYCQPTE